MCTPYSNFDLRQMTDYSRHAYYKRHWPQLVSTVWLGTDLSQSVQSHNKKRTAILEGRKKNKFSLSYFESREIKHKKE